jgi:hypothetical protein
MGLSYDSGARKWNLAYEKTDYNVNRPTNLPETTTVDVVIGQEWVDDGTDLQQIWGTEDVPNEENIALNKKNAELNKKNAELNFLNQQKNNAYNKVQQVTASTQGGDYVNQRNIIRNIQGIDNTLKSTLENYYKTYYTTEKLQPWNSNLGAKPPSGDFDPNYYKQQYPEVTQQWAAAVADDNVDITQRYGEDGFYLQHYTNQGKPAGFRGNKAQELVAAKQYVERKPTDKDLQDVRNIQLNIGTITDQEGNIQYTQSQRLLKVPQISAEWEKAKAGDEYWKKLSKEYLLDLNKSDEFAALFRLSNRPEDKAVAFQYNVNADYGITELEDALNQAVGEKATVNVKHFGALAQDVLKETISEMKKAKAREQQLAMYSGFEDFSEIKNFGKELTNSILGDSGIGGILSFTKKGQEQKESLEKSLQGISGLNNSTTYNWQQWFDNTLKEKYQNDIELGYTKDQAEENVKIEGQFARDFIDKYLIPRFNHSRSMNEFVDYIDVRGTEQNPFQTQDILNAVKNIADLRATQYIDQLKETPERYFDSEFYFNPTGDKAREQQYSNQASTVASDWEAAKKGDSYWTSQAYRFGVDVNNKDAFARMHFQVKGQGQGYDAADDILNASKVSDQIYNVILPALKDKAVQSGTVFGQFIKPEEFANEVLKGVDPTDQKGWQEMLDKLGVSGTDFKNDIEGLKEQIAETLRTGSAQDIRQQIKYLNEQKEKPTQENLGVTYIEREEDYKPVEKTEGETELYKIFKSAGFTGTEDSFYNEFFPDLDREEQATASKLGSSKEFSLNTLDFSDPFSAMSGVESFFNEEQPATKTTSTKSSYFTIDEDENLPTKSKAGQNFLSDFTSFFKGFS